MLRGEGRLTAGEVAEHADVSLEFLLKQLQAIGMPRAGEDEHVYGDDDVEAARQLKQFLDAGLTEQGILEVARVVGESMARIAEATVDLIGRSLLRPGDTERDVGLRYAGAAETLGPLMGPVLEYVFRLYVRETVRSDVVGRADIEAGRLPGAEQVTVCFADLVGFTKLGEELPAEELGMLAGRLVELASDAVEPPVRLVKTIGDAAMLVSPESAPAVDAALELVARADDAGEDFPQLRAGVAAGTALGRAGDWYGSPVNVASRVTGIARPGSVLATSEVRDAAGDEFRWSPAGRRRLKNVREPVPLFRARPLADG